MILPRENEAELADLPPEARAALEFIPASTVEEVFAAAFSPARRRRRRKPVVEANGTSPPSTG